MVLPFDAANLIAFRKQSIARRRIATFECSVAHPRENRPVFVAAEQVLPVRRGRPRTGPTAQQAVFQTHYAIRTLEHAVAVEVVALRQGQQVVVRGPELLEFVADEEDVHARPETELDHLRRAVLLRDGVHLEVVREDEAVVADLSAESAEHARRERGRSRGVERLDHDVRRHHAGHTRIARREKLAKNGDRVVITAGVPFGNLIMTMGTPTRRAYSLLPWAMARGRDEALMSSLLEHAFALGVGLHTDAGMRKAVEAAGLDWAEARDVLDSDDWKPLVEQYQTEMVDGLGLWGVPSFRLSGPEGEPDLAVWGQDRLWLIAAEIRRRAALQP